MHCQATSFEDNLTLMIVSLGQPQVVLGMPCVTVENPPIPFSPFSPTDCTLLSHFSFNDFIAVAFPDLAGDLDIQI